MSSLLVAAVVLATAISTVALGIYAAHCTINGILYAFTQGRQRARLVLVTSETQASGD